MSIKLKLNVIYWMCRVESSCADMECFGVDYHHTIG